MSFGYSIGDIWATLHLANKIRERYVGAPEQLKQISNELAGLSNMLNDIESSLSQQVLMQWQEKSLINALEDCHGILLALRKFAEENSCMASGGPVRLSDRPRIIWKRLVFKLEELKDLRSRMSLSISLLNACSGSLNSHVTFAVKEGVDRLHERYDARELHEDFQEWLTPVDFASQHTDFLRRRQPSTSEWVLKNEIFVDWANKKNKILFCPGLPGAGKTIITAIVIDDLHTKFLGHPDTGIAYLYCNYNRHLDQTSEELMANLLKQLLHGQAFPDYIKNLYQQHKTKGTRPLLSEVVTSLESTVALYTRVYIIVDALDELSGIERARFLPAIFKLQAKTGLSLFTTSRFIPEIVNEFKGCLSFEIRAATRDVESYLDSQMVQLPNFVRVSVDLQNEIKTNISSAVDGMFLLAQLYIASLIGKRSPKAIRTALKELPTGSNAYDHAYYNAVNRIKGQIVDTADLAMQVLAWITFARRPLTTVELQHALAVEIDSSGFDEENLPQIEDIVSACAGLVVVDEQSDIIRLVHYTIKEYLERSQLLTDWFPNIETIITNACITYLSFESFQSGFCQTDLEFAHRLQAHPLYKYAAANWGHHACKASSTTNELIIKFLGDTHKVEAASQAMEVSRRGRSERFSQEVPRKLSGLHLAAFFGLEEAVRTLIQASQPLENVNSHGQTALFWATITGQGAIINLLVEGGMKVDLRDNDGFTALSLAAREGHVKAFRALLEKGATFDSKNNYGRTPLSLAAEYGHQDLVKLLLECGNVSINSNSQFGLTSLAWATMRGHEAAVGLLLEQGADTRLADKRGRDPLSYAAFQGYDKIVKMLLTKGADINTRDWMSRTPLSYAAEGGWETVVQLLLSSDNIEVNTMSVEGLTPLAFAIENERAAVIKLLLDDRRVDPQIKDTNGWTPLMRAVDEGCESIIKQLLEHERVILTTKNRWGQTALSRAAKNGHAATLAMLLQKSHVRADEEDITGWTPLLQAVIEGQEAVLDVLLPRSDVDPDHMDTSGRTPLSWAAGLGRSSIVKRLLATGVVNVNSRDMRGRTPLWWAVKAGQAVTTNLLLAEAADTSVEDYGGRALLDMAFGAGHVAVAKALLDNGADVRSDGWVYLQSAAFRGHSEMERLLRAKGFPDPEEFHGLTFMFRE